MSTIATTPAHLAAPARAERAGSQPARPSGVKGLAAMFLAALVAALVIIADRAISTWADQHLFLAWVLLWAVVFAGIALFAGTARRLAQRVMPWLDGWSRAIAETRAEMRLWEAARRDPRLMAELQLARQRDLPASAAQVEADFADALAPLGVAPAAAAAASDEWAVTPAEKVKMLNGRAYNLYYI